MRTPEPGNAPATVESAAGLDFTPWPAADLANLTDAKLWHEKATSLYLPIRISAALLVKTKAELIELFETQEAEAVTEILDQIGSALSAYGAIVGVLKAAQARLIVAGAAAVQRAEARS